LERQQELNAERRRRDERELELAAEFAVLSEDCDAARAALTAAEVAMGRVVDGLIGELRVRYPRAAQLLQVPEEELRRLRLLSSEQVSPARKTESDTNAVPATTAQSAARGQRGPGLPARSTATTTTIPQSQTAT
jgi:hypothetical protein